MKKPLQALAVLFLISNVPTPTFARTWVVLADGSGDTPTIQEAISQATALDTVLIGSGSFFENLTIDSKGLVLLGSATSPSTLAPAASDMPILRIVGTSLNNSVLERVTVTGAVGVAAIVATEGSPVIRNCVLRDNRAIAIRIQGASPDVIGNTFIDNDNWTTWPSFGASVAVFPPEQESGPVPQVRVVGNSFTGNRSGFGSALYVEYGVVAFTGNIATENWCEYDGGAIFLWQSPHEVTVENNMFTQNIAGDHGGAIAAWNTSGGPANIRMNLFWNNHAFGIDGRGIQGSGGAMSITGRSGVVMNNTIVSNTGSPVCSGDGISLGTYNSASVQWSICNNILVNNGITGLSCASYSDHTTVGNNLFFEQPKCVWLRPVRMSNMDAGRCNLCRPRVLRSGKWQFFCGNKLPGLRSVRSNRCVSNPRLRVDPRSPNDLGWNQAPV